MGLIEMHIPECMLRRTFIISICTTISSANLGCGSQSSSLVGQIEWVDLNAPSIEDPSGQFFGAAFLLLEEKYKSLGYDGPPIGYPKTQKEAVDWHRQMPAEWWSSSSIPHEWWGRGSRREPTEITLPTDIPVHLLRAYVESNGSFEFKDLPLGRHTLFIRWGRNPDPQNNISGPFEVVIDKRGRIAQVFPVQAFDLIDT